ncbi:hypothetical protein BH23GEM9_BH23GEM9_13900 [soil metagenome]
MGAIKKSAKPDMLAYVLMAAAYSFTRPLWFQCVYLGWNTEELAGIFERGFDDMDLTERERFWRKPD